MNWVSIGSDNGLSPNRCEAIFWNSVRILLIEPSGTNFNEFGSKDIFFHSRKCIWKCRLGDGGHFVQEGWVNNSTWPLTIGMLRPKLGRWPLPRQLLFQVWPSHIGRLISFLRRFHNLAPNSTISSWRLNASKCLSKIKFRNLYNVIYKIALCGYFWLYMNGYIFYSSPIKTERIRELDMLVESAVKRWYNISLLVFQYRWFAVIIVDKHKSLLPRKAKYMTYGMVSVQTGSCSLGY